mmetsp:Transcript_31002/g.79076  ORF Transcript_31002/g.79076 Transcript_31002/m.79076 type:complete len:174 (+) Transcript_31002:1401-1922(+)
MPSSRCPRTILWIDKGAGAAGMGHAMEHAAAPVPPWNTTPASWPATQGPQESQTAAPMPHELSQHTPSLLRAPQTGSGPNQPPNTATGSCPPRNAPTPAAACYRGSGPAGRHQEQQRAGVYAVYQVSNAPKQQEGAPRRRRGDHCYQTRASSSREAQLQFPHTARSLKPRNAR